MGQANSAVMPYAKQQRRQKGKGRSLQTPYELEPLTLSINLKSLNPPTRVKGPIRLTHSPGTSSVMQSDTRKRSSKNKNGGSSRTVGSKRRRSLKRLQSIHNRSTNTIQRNSRPEFRAQRRLVHSSPSFKLHCQNKALPRSPAQSPVQNTSSGDDIRPKDLATQSSELGKHLQFSLSSASPKESAARFQDVEPLTIHKSYCGSLSKDKSVYSSPKNTSLRQSNLKEFGASVSVADRGRPPHTLPLLKKVAFSPRTLSLPWRSLPGKITSQTEFQTITLNTMMRDRRKRSFKTRPRSIKAKEAYSEPRSKDDKSQGDQRSSKVSNHETKNLDNTPDERPSDFSDQDLENDSIETNNRLKTPLSLAVKKFSEVPYKTIGSETPSIPLGNFEPFEPFASLSLQPKRSSSLKHKSRRAAPQANDIIHAANQCRKPANSQTAVRKGGRSRNFATRPSFSMINKMNQDTIEELTEESTGGESSIDGPRTPSSGAPTNSPVSELMTPDAHYPPPDQAVREACAEPSPQFSDIFSQAYEAWVQDEKSKTVENEEACANATTKTSLKESVVKPGPNPSKASEMKPAPEKELPDIERNSYPYAFRGKHEFKNQQTSDELDERLRKVCIGIRRRPALKHVDLKEPYSNNPYLDRRKEEAQYGLGLEGEGLPNVLLARNKTLPPAPKSPKPSKSPTSPKSSQLDEKNELREDTNSTHTNSTSSWKRNTTTNGTRSSDILSPRSRRRLVQSVRENKSKNVLAHSTTGKDLFRSLDGRRPMVFTEIGT